MSFIGAPKVSTDALSKLRGRKQAISLDDITLAVDPFGFNRIEPGTLLWEKHRQNAHPFSLLLDLLVVLTNPGAHQLAVVPGSIVPDQQPGGFALCLESCATPLQKLGGDITDRAACYKAKRHLFANWIVGRSLLPEHSIAGESLG